MPYPISPESLARHSANRPWMVVALWMVALVAAVIIAFNLLGDALTTKFEITSDPDSVRADELLEDRLRGQRHTTEIVVVTSNELTVNDLEFRQVVESTFASIMALGPEVIDGGVNFYSTGDPSLVSDDSHTTILPFTMTGDLDDANDNIGSVLDIVRGTEAPADIQVLMTGEATIGDDFQTLSQEDLLRGESIGILLALIILVIVFGALVAALVPVMLALLSIAIAIGLAALIGQAFELSFFITNFITMIGLAVGIDYSLFIVQRFREERDRGRDKQAAIARASATAGRAVLFSGTTVILALVGMLIVPSSVFISLGLGAILVVFVSILASMTLLPALLSLLGDKINRLALPFIGRGKAGFDEDAPSGFWDTVARAVMRRPAITFALGAGLLIATAIPYFSINTGFAGVSTFPDDIESKQAFLILQDEFAAGLVAPTEIVIDGDFSSPAVQEGISRLVLALEADADFAETTVEADEAGDLALLSVPLTVPDDTVLASNAINRLRDEIIPKAFDGVPAEVLVTGLVAFNEDFFDVARDAVIPVFAFVLGMSFILLMVVFRSIIVPLKATLLNLLSVGAAYGLLVLVFQKGYGNEIFGFQQVEAIEAWIPLFLFSVLFGLSMDYHVFLLSRIREHYDRTGDNAGSVAFGIRSTGRLITGAALIMVAVFGGFASGRMSSLEQMGFGLATAILIDATLIRTVMVPAGMKLLGKANWWLPSQLQWLPDLRVEAEPLVIQGASSESDTDSAS